MMIEQLILIIKQLQALVVALTILVSSLNTPIPQAVELVKENIAPQELSLGGIGSPTENLSLVEKFNASTEIKAKYQLDGASLVRKEIKNCSNLRG